jgi:hypothetical protein
LILIPILCFDARFAVIRNRVLKRLTLNMWVHRFQIDCEFNRSQSVQKLSKVVKSLSFKNLQKHVHWTVPVGSREVTYFLFLNDVEKHIPLQLIE